jgi:hypothetical protein
MLYISRIRMPPRAWVFATPFVIYFVGGGLCDRLITCSESYPVYECNICVYIYYMYIYILHYIFWFKFFIFLWLFLYIYIYFFVYVKLTNKYRSKPRDTRMTKFLIQKFVEIFVITRDTIMMPMLFLGTIALVLRHSCSHKENICCLVFVCVCFSILTWLFIARFSPRRPGLMSGESVCDLL